MYGEKDSRYKFTLMRMAKTPEDRQFFRDQVYKTYKSLGECERDLGLSGQKLEKFIQGKVRMRAIDLNRLAKACGFARTEVAAHTEGKLIQINDGEKYQEPALETPDMSKPLTVETISDEGVLNLAAAIVGNAAREYKLAVRKAKKHGIDRKEYERRFSNFIELKNIKTLREYLTQEYNTAMNSFRRNTKADYLANAYASGQLRDVVKSQEDMISEQIAPIAKIISGEKYFYSDDCLSLADINPDALVEKIWREVWKDKNLKISHMNGNA